MAIPPNKNTANTDSTANLATLQAAADVIFVDDATLAILDAIGQGKFFVSLTATPDNDLQALHDYFVALGYAVTYPDSKLLPGSIPVQPAQMFGIFWEQFWAGVLPNLPLPARMVVAWK